jgi:predicted small metal-binding protein
MPPGRDRDSDNLVTPGVVRHLKDRARWSALRRIHMSQTESSPVKCIACADVVPGCDFTASADSEETLMAQVVAHAAHAHGVTDVTPELAAKVKAAIKSR